MANDTRRQGAKFTRGRRDVPDTVDTATLAREFSVKTKLVDVVDMYDGKVTLEFDNAKHRYTIYDDEHPYPGKGRIAQSVTGIIDVLNKPLLVPWAAKTCGLFLEQHWKPGQAYTQTEIAALIVQMKREHKKIKEDAADVGSTVHKWIEGYVKSILETGEAVPWPSGEKEQEACSAFLQWEREHDVKYLHSEFRVYSRKHHYAGTSDLDIEVDHERGIWDLKTSNGIWPEMAMQLAGYQSAREEEGYGPYTHRGIIRCGKDGALEHKRTTEFVKTSYEEDLDGFLAAQKLSRWLAGAKI